MFYYKHKKKELEQEVKKVYQEEERAEAAAQTESAELARLRAINSSLLTELSNMKSHLQKVGSAGTPQMIRVSRRQLTPLSDGDLQQKFEALTAQVAANTPKR
eukprot:COSAG05_NODE_880_length_6791_cov_5.464734_4_plen_103_part_00